MRRTLTKTLVAAAASAVAALGCRDATSPEPESTPRSNLIGTFQTGQLSVTTATSGDDPDLDNYVYLVTVRDVWGSEIGSNAVASNGNVTFTELPPDEYSVELSQVPANCTVNGGHQLTVWVSNGETTHICFDVHCGPSAPHEPPPPDEPPVGEEPPPPPPPPPPTGTRAAGLGAFGPGPAQPGSDRFDFDFDVSDAPGGQLFIQNWNDVPPATLTVDPADPETGVTSFTQTSEQCVQFGGAGRLNSGTLVRFIVDVCDNADPGVGSDTFRVELPDDGFVAEGTLSEGDIRIGMF